MASDRVKEFRLGRTVADMRAPGKVEPPMVLADSNMQMAMSTLVTG